MRLRIERAALADAVTWAARALPSRPVVPILAGLLLEADADGLVLSCFDYEVSARVRANAAVAEPGRAVVSGRLLAEIARSLPPQPVDLRSDADNVILSCGPTRFTLLALPVDDFPALPPSPPQAGTVSGQEFATAVGQVAIAAGRDDTLPMLTGILIELDGATMTLVATDRYRMAVRELDWQPARPNLQASVLVPARTLAEAAKSMSAGTEIALSLSTEGERAPSAGGTAAPEGLIGFEGGARRLTTRLLGTEFVTYKSRFPREYGSRALLKAGPFGEAIRRVALVADRDSRMLLTFAEGDVVIETGSADGSQAVETVTAEFEGDEGFAIAFKPQYLLDGIGAAAAGDAAAGDAAAGDAAAGDAQPAKAGSGAAAEASAAGERPDQAEREVVLQFTAPEKPAVITGSRGYRYLLAPMRT